MGITGGGPGLQGSSERETVEKMARDKNRTAEGEKEGGENDRGGESERGCRENTRTQGLSVLSFARR